VRATMSEGKGVLSTLPERFCGICFAQGREGRLVTNPYCGECGHVYCYACLLGEVVGEEGDGWTCLRCGSMVRHIRRWVEKVEIEGEEGKEQSSKEEEAEENVGDVSEVEIPEIESEEEDSVEDVDEDSNEENLFSRG
jgi:peroxin-2